LLTFRYLSSSILTDLGFLSYLERERWTDQRLAFQEEAAEAVGPEDARKVIWGLIGVVEGRRWSASLPSRLSMVISELPRRAVISEEC